jgi:pimeloyl-ACP methyl ester carboxylesterase
MLRRLVLGLATTLAVGSLILTGLITFGGPSAPPLNAKLASHDPAIRASLADQPAPETFQARDGASLSFRRYPGAADGGVIVLVHGSSGSNRVSHRLATALSQAGATVFAVDIRGHGASGPHGDISYATQLDDDMADLARVLDRTLRNEKRLLVGHSSGGGFILHVAASKYACAFDGFLATSPYLNHRSPANRPDGGWANAGVPRIVGLIIVNRFGVTAFDGLPTVRFAIPQNLANRTPFYSWRLMRNFGLDMDKWEQEIKSISRPTRVIIGADDELFFGDQFPALFAKLQPDIGVQVVPGADHMGVTVEDRPIDEIARTARELFGTRGAERCLALTVSLDERIDRG